MDTPDMLLPARLVLARYTICGKTLDRWVHNPRLGFPAPILINKRKYFRIIDLQEWERLSARRQGARA